MASIGADGLLALVLFSALQAALAKIAAVASRT
jgi:hypothetical protein